MLLTHLDKGTNQSTFSKHLIEPVPSSRQRPHAGMACFIKVLLLASCYVRSDAPVTTSDALATSSKNALEKEKHLATCSCQGTLSGFHTSSASKTWTVFRSSVLGRILRRTSVRTSGTLVSAGQLLLGLQVWGGASHDCPFLPDRKTRTGQ